MLDFSRYLKNCDKSKGNFFLQYLSLILIILVFTIGAFLRGPQVEAKATEVIPEEKSIEDNKIPTKELSEIKYTDLFKANGTELNGDIADALIMLLKNHDIDVEITLAPLSETDADYNLTLGRAITLSKFFGTQGLPRNSWRILSSDLPNGSQAIIKFSEEQL